MSIIGTNSIINQWSPDYRISNPQTGQALIYDANKRAFINAFVPGGTDPSVMYLTDLADVAISAATPGQVLKNVAPYTWVNADLSWNDLIDTPAVPATLDDLTDTVITTLVDGDYLVWDASVGLSGSWVNKQILTTDGQNIGTGQGSVFAQLNVATNQLQFKTLKAGANVTIIDSPTEIVISTTSSSGDIGDAFVSVSGNAGAAAAIGDAVLQIEGAGSVTTAVLSMGNDAKVTVTGNSVSRINGTTGSYIATGSGILDVVASTPNISAIASGIGSAGTLALSVNGFLTLTADTGNIIASGAATAGIRGGTHISTSVVGSDVYVNYTGPLGVSTFVALSDTDSVVVSDGYLRWNSAGTSISYSSTIPWSDLSGTPALIQTEIMQDAVAPLFTTGVHTGISLVYNDAGNQINITNTDRGSSQHIFKRISVPGETDVVVDSNDTTLNFIGTGGVNITTNNPSKTITFDFVTPIMALTDLTDVFITSPITAQVVRHNGTQWVNSALSISDITNLQTSLDGKVTSVFGRTGLAITAQSGDYTTSLISNVSTILSGTGTLTDALNQTITTGSNLGSTGSRVGVFFNKTGSSLNFRSLVAGNNIGLDTNISGEIKIDYTGSVGIGDAPNDGQVYSRKNLTWVIDPIQVDAPIDGQVYGRFNGTWALAGSGSTTVTSVNGGAGLNNSSGITTGAVTINVGQGDGILVDTDTVSVNFSTSGGNNGVSSLVARADHAHLLDNLSDVTTAGATDGQVLTYNAGVWTPGSTVATTLDGLSDVAITAPTNTQLLAYEQSSGQWKNVNPPTTGGLFERVVMKYTGGAGGTLAAPDALVSQTSGVTTTITDGVNSIVKFNFSAYPTPPKSIIIYGQDYTTNTFTITTPSNLPSANRKIIDNGTAASPNLLANFGLCDIMLQIRMSDVGASSSGLNRTIVIVYFLF